MRSPRPGIFLTFVKTSRARAATLIAIRLTAECAREEIMIQAFAEWLKRRRDRAELNALDIGERERVAHDLGVGAPELDYLVRVAHDPVELSRMMAAIGIDEEALKRAQPALRREIERVCSLCETTTLCRHELASGTAGVSYRYFCPNAEELKALSRKARARG
jgi:uncharacterized protein YjiS (DUF1127 family)